MAQKPYIPSEHVQAYLRSWFNTSIENKRKAGAVIELTYEQFMEHVITPRQVKSLDKAYSEFRLKDQQAISNPYAYVITWVSYSAKTTNIYNVNTAVVTTRVKSSIISKPKKGEKLRPSHVANLSKSMTGKKKSDDHRRNISDSMKGRVVSDDTRQSISTTLTGTTNTDLTRQRKSEAAKARWAAKRAEKEKKL